MPRNSWKWFESILINLRSCSHYLRFGHGSDAVGKWRNNFQKIKNKWRFESDWKWTQRVVPYRPVWYDDVYCLMMEKHLLEEKSYCTCPITTILLVWLQPAIFIACHFPLSLPISCLILHLTLSNEVVKMPQNYPSRKKICFNRRPSRYFRYWVNSPARISSPHTETVQQLRNTQHSSYFAVLDK